jgi:hypothetical protein
MMKRLLVLSGLLLTAALIGQVEHAPTVAQCQADQRLWDYQFIHEPEKLPTVDVLQKWNSEMRDCLKVDPQAQLQYLFTAAEADTETEVRMMHFLQRHDMLTAFRTEDATGKR